MTKMQQVLELAHDIGAIRAKDVEAKGIHRDYLKRLEQQRISLFTRHFDIKST